jgi:hypothetical protein
MSMLWLVHQFNENANFETQKMTYMKLRKEMRTVRLLPKGKPVAGETEATAHLQVQAEEW